MMSFERVILNGKNIDKFSVIGNYDRPVVIGNLKVPVKGVRMTMIFDSDLAAISQVEDIYLLENGSERLFYKVDLITLQHEELPIDLATLLED